MNLYNRLRSFIEIYCSLRVWVDSIKKNLSYSEENYITLLVSGCVGVESLSGKLQYIAKSSR